MKQFSIQLKRGAIQVEEVPAPGMRAGGVLVQNRYSLISAGTERSSVEKRQSSLLAKAKANPDLVRLVVKQMREQGVTATYRRVMNKLEDYAPLGYSCAGTVMAVAGDVDEFAPGDLVACGGSGANHAEVVAVPKNLCVKVPAGVPADEAAFTTVGAIALQGVRLSRASLGETVAVIGLGLVGQLTIQILKAAGCHCIGIDVDQQAVDLARGMGADAAVIRSSRGLKAVLTSQTQGYGADAVIITAATKSDDPVTLAAELCRDKGRVIVVGDVGLGLPREPYYLKELEFRISRSYGPGRYDRQYEEQGRDYPIGYVRWTERRNMEEFLRLVADEKVNLKPLMTHTFPIAKAADAYRLIAGPKRERTIGVLLQYGTEPPERRPVAVGQPMPKEGRLSIGFIGAGNFARGFLLPHLNPKNVNLTGVCNANGLNAKNVARQFGFEFATADPKDIFGSPAIDAVFIATRHDAHARLAVEGLKNRKHVFVEKPLALNEAELEEIVRAYRAALKKSSLRFMVGFNRRFSPPVRRVKEFFSGIGEPAFVNYRVNAGYLAPDHWTQDPVQGGGRIIGEVCHFIDTIQFLSGGVPTRVFAQTIAASGNRTQSDNVAITMRLSSGGVGVISYLANGDPGLPKERIEISAGGRSAVIDNFASVELFEGGKRSVESFGGVDKGHGTEVKEFIESIHAGRDLIPFDSLVATTRATFTTIASLETGSAVEL